MKKKKKKTIISTSKLNFYYNNVNKNNNINISNEISYFHITIHALLVTFVILFFTQHIICSLFEHKKHYLRFSNLKLNFLK